MPVTDWRYDNLKFLRGARFRFVPYKAPTDDWDHDHCNGCWAKFGAFDGPDILHEGYVHAKPYEPGPEPQFIAPSEAHGARYISAPTVNGCQLQWLCADCFNDFREDLGFGLDVGESTT